MSEQFSSEQQQFKVGQHLRQVSSSSAFRETFQVVKCKIERVELRRTVAANTRAAVLPSL